MTRESQPLVTVIALCYNHERFLGKCLDSIRAQTFQDFELIVTDDCSKDSSADLIEAWLAKHRPDAVFVRHRQNAGVCKTLNEALTMSTGKHISMIATDDLWEPAKIEQQLAHIEAMDATVAVVYSNALRIDEEGNVLPGLFIETEHPELKPPSGDVFDALAKYNFLPAMATLVRSDALRAVGGYDERLAFEDWDMWIRLAERYHYSFLDETVARYRIVGKSLARTLFHSGPTRGSCATHCMMATKILSSQRIGEEQRRHWIELLCDNSYIAYCLDDPRAAGFLRAAYKASGRTRWGLLAAAATLGVPRDAGQRLLAKFTGHPDA